MGKWYFLAQAAVAKYHGLGRLSNRKLFFTVLEMQVQDQDASGVRFSF